MDQTHGGFARADPYRRNLYTRRGFLPFIIHQGCHIAQKKISDLADLYDMPVSSHNASSALGAMASAHGAAGMRDFKGHELSVGRFNASSNDLPWGHINGDPIKGWSNLITHDGPLVKDGRILIPDKPGLGVEPDPDYVRAHLARGETWWG